MIDPKNRRQFLKTAAVGGMAWSAADWAFLGTLPRVSAGETAAVSDRVQFTPEIEPLVRLIEDTPREQVLERLAGVIRKGTPYREVLAALQLTGIRNVQPRPSVGFKFHSVLVVNSCHLASVAGPEDERWLPIFWAIDYVKSTQAEEASKTGWKMKPVNEAKVPHGPDAAKLFAEAMESWNVEKADVATAGIVRSLKKDEVFELFARYAARDFRDIGHKAIFLANAWRTLEVIGWQHAEPVLRSLAFAMMNHGSDPSPATNDLAADRPWKQNAALITGRPETTRVDAGATNELIAGHRIGNAHETAKNAAEILSSGVSAGSVWDGVFVSAGELLMRQPGIVALHGLTSANALHYIAGQVKDETLRQRLLLQACSFNALFRDAAKGRGELAKLSVSDVAPLGGVSGGPFTVDEIFADVSGDKLRASRKLCSYLNGGGDAKAVLDAARRLVFQKGSNSHDYKFSSAVLENFAHVSPEFRNQFLALAVFNLKGTSDKDSRLIGRTRAALHA